MIQVTPQSLYLYIDAYPWYPRSAESPIPSGKRRAARSQARCVCVYSHTCSLTTISPIRRLSLHVCRSSHYRHDRIYAIEHPHRTGETPFRATRLQSVKVAHPEMPIFATLLSTLPALINGATVNIWGSHDPIVCCCFNVNHSQTRKSRLTSMAEKMHESVDEAMLELYKAIFEEKALMLACVCVASHCTRVVVYITDRHIAPVNRCLYVYIHTG